MDCGNTVYNLAITSGKKRFNQKSSLQILRFSIVDQTFQIIYLFCNTKTSRNGTDTQFLILLYSQTTLYSLQKLNCFSTFKEYCERKLNQYSKQQNCSINQPPQQFNIAFTGFDKRFADFRLKLLQSQRRTAI